MISVLSFASCFLENISCTFFSYTKPCLTRKNLYVEKYFAVIMFVAFESNYEKNKIQTASLIKVGGAERSIRDIA